MNRDGWGPGYWGRTIGLLIILFGFSLAVWNAWALPHVIPADYAAQTAIRDVLKFLYWGLTIIVVAELAFRLGWRSIDGRPPYVALLRFARAGAALIIVAGIFVSGWEGIHATAAESGSVAAQGFFAGSLRYVFDGFVIIILAELASRTGWPSRSYEPSQSLPDPDSSSLVAK